MSEEFDELTGPGVADVEGDDAGTVALIDEDEEVVVDDEAIDPLLETPDAGEFGDSEKEGSEDIDPEEEGYFFQNFEGRE
ncbi:MAG: hypothetical protein V4478_02325 [Patescibacteria group bacterium]